MEIPQMIKIKQRFSGECIPDVEAEVRKQIDGTGISFPAGASVAIAVGSRGIADIARIVKTTVEVLKAKGAAPFLVPAMGSHGGATAEGQEEVLKSYGITEETVGAPIRSSMQTVELFQGRLPARIFMDKHAYEADGIVVINRIKVHTDFHGATESGLMKMCVVGLGKHKQALEMHRFGVYGLRELVPAAARVILESGKITLGIGIVENAYDRTMAIRAVLPQDMEREELLLLELNRRNMPGLPVRQADILLIDEMGKDISGTGVDPNIIGRIRIRDQQEPEYPRISTIIAADLTEASHGNALGMGLADFITKRLCDKIDWKATYENVLTSTFTERGKMPVVADTDRKAMEYALRTCGRLEAGEVRALRIRNTLKLDEIYVSKPILEDIYGKDTIEVIGTFRDMFDEDGALIGF